jgi:hypothetical protein
MDVLLTLRQCMVVVVVVLRDGLLLTLRQCMVVVVVVVVLQGGRPTYSTATTYCFTLHSATTIHLLYHLLYYVLYYFRISTLTLPLTLLRPYTDSTTNSTASTRWTCT